MTFSLAGDSCSASLRTVHVHVLICQSAHLARPLSLFAISDASLRFSTADGYLNRRSGSRRGKVLFCACPHLEEQLYLSI